jgi:hypothetical protein
LDAPPRTNGSRDHFERGYGDRTEHIHGDSSGSELRCRFMSLQDMGQECRRWPAMLQRFGPRACCRRRALEPAGTRWNVERLMHQVAIMTEPQGFPSRSAGVRGGCFPTNTVTCRIGLPGTGRAACRRPCRSLPDGCSERQVIVRQNAHIAGSLRGPSCPTPSMLAD